MSAPSWKFALVGLGLIALEHAVSAQTTTAIPAPNAKPPVDQLIPWLLREDGELRGIAFSEVILDATGKRVLPFDPKNEDDQRVLKHITAALDAVVARLNEPDSVIQSIGRINEVSSHFEEPCARR
jgi:hypothetical protein